MNWKTALALSSLAAAQPAIAADSPPFSDSATEYVVSSPIPTDFMPNSADINAVVEAFDAFQNLLGRGQLREAYEMMTDGNQQETPWEGWSSRQSSSAKQYGVDNARQLFRIMWYPNPESAPSPGLYVAVDYAARLSSDAFRCGYIILYKADDASFKVARIDSTYVPSDLMAGKLPRQDVLQGLPCYLGQNTKTAFGLSQ